MFSVRYNYSTHAPYEIEKAWRQGDHIRHDLVVELVEEETYLGGAKDSGSVGSNINSLSLPVTWPGATRHRPRVRHSQRRSLP